jgi:alpha/beta superfamily hydrolase
MYIIPGFKHTPQQKAYQKIITILESEGFETIPVTIPWKETTISQNTEFFLKHYKKISRKKKYIIGFSYGAMIAFLASTKIDVSGIILCSLSPYFKEDVLNKKTTKRSPLTIERHEDFLQLECSHLAKKVKTKHVSLLYGTQEARSLVKRVNEAYNYISSPQKNIIRIKKTDHNIGDKNYLNTIHEVIKTLN